MSVASWKAHYTTNLINYSNIFQATISQYDNYQIETYCTSQLKG